MVSGRHASGSPGRGRGAAMADRGRVRNRKNRVGPRPQRDPKLARLASPCLAGDARLRPAHGDPPQGGHLTPKKTTDPSAKSMVRWSLQEIRRIAWRLIQRRIEPAFVIAWSVWRRCHQATAQKSHFKRNPQL